MKPKKHIRILLQKLAALGITANPVDKRSNGHVILAISSAQRTRTMAVANTPTVPEYTINQAIKEAVRLLEHQQ